MESKAKERTSTTTKAPFIEPETTVEPPKTTFIITTEPEQVSVPEKEYK